MRLAALACLLATPALAYAEVGAVLRPDDAVGISFWIISMALIAATAFFFASSSVAHSPVGLRPFIVSSTRQRHRLSSVRTITMSFRSISAQQNVSNESLS